MPDESVEPLPSDWIERFEVSTPPMVSKIDPASFPGGMHELTVALIEDGTSRTIGAPALVARGKQPGPIVGITAAVHGNELNGIPTIYRLFRTIDPEQLTGTVIGVPIVNIPGYLRHMRLYPDLVDLNRIMPGKPDGSESQVYAHRVNERILSAFDVLIDLHTASFGRVNTLYVRADMRHEATARIARTIGADIIIHNAGADGTVRAAVASKGKPAITVEIGDPQVIDSDKVRISRIGIRDVLELLGMLPPDDQTTGKQAVECERSFWLYTDTGGVLECTVALSQRLRRGDRIAVLRDPLGRLLRTYRAPSDGIVVGKSTNPVARTGSRILHLGVVG